MAPASELLAAGRELSIRKIQARLTYPAQQLLAPPPSKSPTQLSHQTPTTATMAYEGRVGSRFGGGGVASHSVSNQDRRERLRKLALETIDLDKDPYL